MGILVGKYDGAMEPPCAGVSVGDAVGMRVPCIVHKGVTMMALFLSAFVTLFVIIDPIGVSPIFASLTADASKAQARSMAIRATVISALILLGFAFMGEAFHKMFPIADRPDYEPDLANSVAAIAERTVAIYQQVLNR